MSLSFRHGDVAVHITVDAADGHHGCPRPAGETILYPPAHADLVLPVTDPGDVELHYRPGIGSWRSGLGDGEFSRYAGIPFGLLGRHLVMFLCTETFRCRTRTITLHPHRIYGFLAGLGSLSEQTVRGGWFTELQGQLQRTLRHGWIGEHPGATGTLVSTRGRHGHSLLDSSAEHPPAITLDAEFAKSALRWVPLDSEVVRVLSRKSCTALDVYAWLTYIGMHLDDARQFTWESVEARFASPTPVSPAAPFRPVFEACLEDIRRVTAIPSVTADASGIEIRPASGCVGSLHSAWPS